MQGFRCRRVADLGEPGHDVIGLGTWRSNLRLRRVWRESFLSPVLLSVLVVLLVVAVAAPAQGATSELFTDVPDDHPYAAAIEQLYYSGIIVGFEDRSFRPEADVKRMQFTKMLVRALGDFVLSEADLCPFPDVYRGSELDFYPDNYIAVAARAGITRGYPDGTFRPSAPIARAQVITMVVRAMQHRYPGLLAAPSAVSPWGGAEGIHAPQVALAQAEGLLAGLPLTALDPWGPMTRGEVAQIMSNLLAKLWSLGPDAAEPDETADQARVYEVGSGWRVGTLDPGYDTDWIRFATVPGHTYRVRFVVNDFTFWDLALFRGTNASDAVELHDNRIWTRDPQRAVMVFQATARSALLRMRSIESPGGDGHPGDPTVCAYHVMVEEPTVHGLSGRVVDVHGNPLQGITVRAWEESGLSPEATTVTGVDGSYRFSSLLAGVFRVEATGAGYLSSVYSGPAAVVGAGVDVRGGDVSGVDLALQEAASVRLLVVDERGRPVAVHATLWFGDEAFGPDVEGPPIWPDWPEIYVFSNLAAGDYEVNVGYGAHYFSDPSFPEFVFSWPEPIGSLAFSLAEGETRDIALQVPPLDLNHPRELAQHIILRGFWLDFSSGGTMVFLPARLPSGWHLASEIPSDVVRKENPWVHRGTVVDSDGIITHPYMYDVAYTDGDSLVFVSFSIDGGVGHLPFDRSGRLETSQSEIKVPQFLWGSLWGEYNPAPLWERHVWPKTVVYATPPSPWLSPRPVISVSGGCADEAVVRDIVESMRCWAISD